MSGLPPNTFEEAEQLFQPMYWTTTGPRSASFCVTSTTTSLSTRIIARRAGDFIGLKWQSTDPLGHDSSGYTPISTYSGAVLSFDVEVTGNLPNIDSETQGLTLTVRRESGGVVTDHFVRVANYGTVAAGGRTASITIDFDDLRAGFFSDQLVPPDGIVEMFFGVFTTGFVDGSTTPLAPKETGELLLTNVGCTANMVARVPNVTEHGFRMSTGYDDYSGVTPERVIHEIHVQGYRGRVNHYCGMSTYPEREWNSTEGRFNVVKTGQLLNACAVQWHEALCAAAVAAGLDVLFSVSYELLSELCPFEWAQRTWDGGFAETGWTPSSYILSPGIDNAMDYLHGVFVEFGNLLNGNAADIWMQVGEPWWWYNGGTLKPCFYDSSTRTKFNNETGLFAPEFTDIHDTSTGTPYDEFKVWLRDLLGKSTQDIRDAIKLAHPTAKVAPLFFLPSVLDSSSGIMSEVNYPKSHWQSPEWDFFQTESYDWIIRDELTKAEQAFTLPVDDLGYSSDEIHYLAGFVPTTATGKLIDPEYTLETHGVGVWGRIFNTSFAGIDKGVVNQYVWALPQVMRDSVLIRQEGDTTKIYVQGIFVAMPPLTDEEKFQASYADASAADPKPTALIRPADVQRSIDTDVSNLKDGPNLYTVEVIFDIGELENLNPYNPTTGKPRVFFVKDDQPGLRQGKNLLLKSYQIRDADPSVPVTCTFWG